MNKLKVFLYNLKTKLLWEKIKQEYALAGSKYIEDMHKNGASLEEVIDWLDEYTRQFFKEWKMYRRKSTGQLFIVWKKESA